jgi:hypothetical protein
VNDFEQNEKDLIISSDNMGLFSKKAQPTSGSVYVPPSNNNSNVDYSNMAAPKKYTKVNGVMKLNPEYKRWTEAQNQTPGGGDVYVPTTSVAHPDKALPIVSSMEDHEQLNEVSTTSGGQEIPLSESTNATIEMMQEPEISLEAGMTPDTMVDELGSIMNKYEVPMGLMNKLMMLSEFQSLEFIIDDSGSMSLVSDTVNPITKRPNTRWEEAQQRLKEMIEILAYVPFTQVDIVFLNRPDQVVLKRNARDPKSFLADAHLQIDRVFAKGPAGTTPVLEKLQTSFINGQGKDIARYFFGDGVPNGGLQAQKEITRILCARQNPEGNPVTFISCTNDDAAVEWMKDTEEVAPYCSESDDFGDEAEEVLRDQGAGLPYSKGFHLICQLVAAMNPDDLDAMDESVPFTKATLDNLLGVVHNVESYKHYFDCFTEAQRMRIVEKDDSGRPKKSDQLKKSVKWNYQDFLVTPLASQIPHVQQIKEQLKQMMI